MTTQTAFVVDDGFGLHNISRKQLPQEAVGPNDVRLIINAVALNYRDLMMVKGQYNPRQLLPLIPCSDAVGTVVETGSEVTSPQLGDRVCTLLCQGWIDGTPTRETTANMLGGPKSGVLATEIVLPKTGVASVPSHLSDCEAATLPCAGTTAYAALCNHADPKPGDCVLIQGTGGVSLFALAICRALDLRAIVTSGSDEKLRAAKALGATHGINYLKDRNWGKTARKLSGGDGVDIVIDVGGAATLEQSITACRPGATIAIVGVLSGAAASVNVIPIMMRQLRLQGVLVGSRRSLVGLVELFERERLRPVVDQVFTFDDSVEAFSYLESAAHFGKVVIEVCTESNLH